MSKEEYMQIYELIGAAMEVHNELGYGLDETIYQEALQRELALRNISCKCDALMECYYKGQKMNQHYKADILCNGIIVELKSVDKLTNEHRTKLFTCMRITHSERGVLINFGEKSLKAERYLLDMQTNEPVFLTKENLEDYIH